MTEYNPQSQPKIVWPAAFPVVRSYLDQLVRNNGLAAARTTAIASALDAAEKQTGAARGASLTKLATQVDADVSGAKDSARVKAMSAAIKAARGGVEVAVTARRRGRRKNKATLHRDGVGSLFWGPVVESPPGASARLTHRAARIELPQRRSASSSATLACYTANTCSIIHWEPIL